MAENGDQLGIVAVGDALRMAEEQNVDLVEIAPLAVPPVCKLMDYGKFCFCLSLASWAFFCSR